MLNGISEVEKIREEQKEALGHLVVGISSLDSFKEQVRALAEKSECKGGTSRTCPVSRGENPPPLSGNQVVHRGRPVAPLFRFQVFQLAKSSCPVGCGCVCHTRHCLQSPQIFHNIFGSLLIAYTGLPFPSRRCNEFTCQKQSTAAAQISYCFPKWLLMRVVSFVVTKTSVGDPVACLKVRRSVPVHADILRLASLGEVSNMTTLFEKRTASPMDISISDGRSVLHVGVFC